MKGLEKMTGNIHDKNLDYFNYLADNYEKIIDIEELNASLIK